MDSAPPVGRVHANSAALERVAFILAAAAFSAATRYVYADVLGPARALQYMGVRVLPASAGTMWLFGALAVLPAIWLPVHLRRPSDVVQLFLYYAVHIPTAVVMPLVSHSPQGQQLVFVLAIGTGIVALDVRHLLPQVHFPVLKLDARIFWFGVALFCATAVGAFAASGYLSFDHLRLVDVYGQRLELAARAGEIGKFFFYMANWSGTALAPFLIVAGLHKKRWWLIGLGIALATLSFIASSNRANYAAIGAVIGGYFAIRLTRGRDFGIIMGGSFLLLTQLLLLIDRRLDSARGIDTPVVTFGVFHRIFTNNGFLSAIYLDLARDRGNAYYQDSFLRWLPGPRFEAPVPVLAGASFTDVPGVWANANLWADAYANLGYAGIVVAFAMTVVILWLFDSIAARKDAVVAASLLVVPAAILANNAPYLALISNGMFVVFILLYAWSGADRAETNG